MSVIAVFRPLLDTDCRRVAEIDLAARGEAATLASLGVSFFTVLYRAFIKSGEFLAFVCEESQEIRGFVLGCTDTRRAIRRALMRACIPLAMSAIGRCVKHPGLIPDLLVTLHYPERSKIAGPELLVIAVDPAHQLRGVGTALTRLLNEVFLAKGFGAYRVSVKQVLVGANRFYHRLGFCLVDQFTLYGEPWNTYEYRLSAEKVCSCSSCGSSASSMERGGRNRSPGPPQRIPLSYGH